MAKIKEKNYPMFRRWLNSVNHHDTGWYQLSRRISNVNADPECSKPSADIGLQIADCSRSINLSFDIWDEKDFKERRKKIQLIREALDKIEGVLDLTEELYEQWTKNNEKV